VTITNTDADEHGALHGVRVLEIADSIAGTTAAMLLGDLGADVVRVEGQRASLARDPGYVCWTRNKMVVELDRATPAGLTEIRRLVAATDVVVTDLGRAELEQLRLDAASVRAVNERVVHIWEPAYGHVGQWSNLPHDHVVLGAVSGHAGVGIGAPAGSPLKPSSVVVPLLAYQQGAMAATAAVAGLFRRARTGVAQAASTSGLQSVAAMLAAVMADAPRKAAGGGSGGLPHYRMYQCGDGEWLFLGALAQPFFLRALEVLELMDVMVMPGVDGQWLNLQLADVAPTVIERLAARFQERSRDEWLKVLYEADVPCAPLSTRDEWFDSETVALNGWRVARPHAELGVVDLPSPPLRMSDAATEVRHLADGTRRVAPGTCWTAPPPALPAATAPELADAAPLAGIRVLDLAAFVAGTFGPSILCDLGAEVIKVEAPGGDPYRDFPISFAAFNQSKRGLGLDMKQVEGRALFLELVAGVDVVADGVRPGVRTRLGTDAATLHRVNPRLVRCSVTGWGEVGPLAETPAFDPLVQSRSGLAVAQGGPTTPQLIQGMLVHDIGTGTLAALGILAALYQRETATGRGQEVVLSLASASTFFQSGELTRYASKPVSPVGNPGWAGPSAVRRLYECVDGWIVVGARDEIEARTLVDELGLDVTLVDPTSPQAALLAESVGAAIASCSSAELVDRLCLRGIPAAAVLPRDHVFTDPWLAENGMFHHVEQPDLGTCTLMSGYITWPGVPVGYRAYSPGIGANSREVLAELGVDAGRIDALLATGAVHGTA